MGKDIYFRVVAKVPDGDRVLLLENDDYSYYAIATPEQAKTVKVKDLIKVETAGVNFGFYRKIAKKA
jgi:hypothetical protein